MLFFLAVTSVTSKRGFSYKTNYEAPMLRHDGIKPHSDTPADNATNDSPCHCQEIEIDITFPVRSYMYTTFDYNMCSKTYKLKKTL